MDERSDEAALRTRFRDGDPEAVRAVYRRYAGPMMTVARSVLSDRDLAQEAVQQAFMQAWRSAERFDVTCDLAPWLYAITRRVCIDIFRRERRRPGVTATGDVPVEVGAHDVEEAMERSWQAWQVRRALDSLDVREREVLRLAHFEGLSNSEVASRLGLPLGTVKSRTHRAHRRLAEQLGHLRAARRQEPAPCR